MKLLYLALAPPEKPGMPPFQLEDLHHLQSLSYDLQTLVWHGREYRELLTRVRASDAVLAWNIGRHSWIASWLGRPLACVVGGYEFASIPELDYGGLRTPSMRWMTKRVWRTAELIYNSQALADDATRAFGSPGRAHVLPMGYDAAFWTPGQGERRDRVVSVCHAPTEQRFRLKGVDLLLQTARLLPSIEFAVVGETPPGFRPDPRLANVEFSGWLQPEALREMYRTSKVSAQLSIHEGFGSAIAEAMLCGCVPVGTAAGGIPEAMGPTGFVVPRQPEAIAEAIRRALAAEDRRTAAREWIASRYTPERRREGLRDVIEGLAAAR